MSERAKVRERERDASDRNFSVLNMHPRILHAHKEAEEQLHIVSAHEEKEESADSNGVIASRACLDSLGATSSSFCRQSLQRLHVSSCGCARRCSTHRFASASRRGVNRWLPLDDTENESRLWQFTLLTNSISTGFAVVETASPHR